MSSYDVACVCHSGDMIRVNNENQNNRASVGEEFANFDNKTIEVYSQISRIEEKGYYHFVRVAMLRAFQRVPCSSDTLHLDLKL